MCGIWPKPQETGIEGLDCVGLGEMAQCLKALNALIESLYPILSTHVAGYQHL